MLEIELAAIEAREVGQPAAQRIEADQLRIQRADARRERVDLAVDLAAGRLQVGLLLGDRARIGALLGIGAEQEAPEHEAGNENRSDDQDRSQEQRAAP